jgi:hypothetical protein
MRLSVIAVAVSLTVTAGPPAAAGHRRSESRVTAVTVDRTDSIGRFGGEVFERLIGHVEGRVHRSESVVGLKEFLGRAHTHRYRSAFEVIRPVDPHRRRLAVVEVENRGSPFMLQVLNRFVIGFSGPPAQTTYPPDFGDGFLFSGGRSYARLQWQTGIAADVPSTAQGVGEVIVRDFGRLLRSGRLPDGPSSLGRYPTVLVTGISQSGWFINTLLAEGFNAAPGGHRVFDGALVVAAAGNWLAINHLGDDGQPQQPYVRPDGRPLPAGRILTRPRTDPFFVDVVTYTDFYRLRASLARDPDPPRRSRRYELAAAHLPGLFVDDKLVFDTLACNDKNPVPLSPLDYRPYIRAALVGLEGELGVTARRLPPSTTFRPGPEPARSAYFNDLPGAHVSVPEVDGESQPRGGVRMPDIDLPLGRLEPVALPRVTTSGITAICGNFGGYQPFTASELAHRYGTIEGYDAQLRPLVDRMVRRGHLLARDKSWIVADLRQRYNAAQ